MKKSLVRIASMLFPNGVTSFAYKQLTNPQVHKLRENELATLHKADRSKLKFKDFDIQLYTWRSGPKSVLLIHGWEGQAGNFSDLIEALLKNHYTVYAFDGPSHGFSSKGKTSLFEFTELVAELIKTYKVKHLVSHSFGGVATTYTLYQNQNITIDKYVLLTTPDKFSERINDVCERVGINANIKKRLIERLEYETGQSVLDLNVSDFVKSINVKQALIIHDKNDKVIPVNRSKNVHDHWSQSEFRVIENTGHFRILRTALVIDWTIAFLN